ncbi:hypothetical protein [Streptomyces sp. H27-C3]|uniref:hypothetical protein n=1 Tax=Streptomyces sp. H27-C3 TaxID=3046305 RepID=UPI0024BB6786|nr:hypothetical protein [Streptomyces sp. H27-C3]MDJ0463430.1 hypothetical protein [Streptomyces sp. H27-C3]
MNIRTIGIAAVVVLTVLLPLAGASAEPEPAPAPDDAKGAPRTTPSPRPSPEAVAEGARDIGGPSAGAGAAGDTPGAPGTTPRSTAQCGPELSSPEGIEAQTCVLTDGDNTWARAYYRNATGEELRAVLTLMGPANRTVQMHCAVGAEDEPGVCETPREPIDGKAAQYTAVSEFAARGDGPLLLRSGSNSARSASS